MSSSDNETNDGQTVRASGRVRRRPETMFDHSPPAAGEKRTYNEADDEEEDEDDITSDEGEPDEEEMREKRAKSRKQTTHQAKRPPQKKTKVNGNSTLAFRTAGHARGKTARLSALDAEAAGGIFAEVFAQHRDPQEIVSDWLARFQEHESRSLAEIINFVLRAAGCTSTVSEEQMEDPDNITSVITDLQDEFQASEPTEYPLAKKSTASTVKQRVMNVMDTLIKSLAQELMFSQPELLENIQSWLVTMSTAANRPFRHTATVLSLFVMTSLAEVAEEAANDAVKVQRQVDNEKRKAAKNKARISDIESKAEEANTSQEFVQGLLDDWFNTVFIHRYKDVDPAIRKECASALGQWISIQPSRFLDGGFLRYLGWMLSDVNVSVRAEVVKQLTRVYKPDNIGRLANFTDRFRQRMVEMATSDADTQVRTSSIELLDQLRENALLEPDDIDAIGRLIFESEVKIRRATAKFLAEGIQEVYTMKMDEMGEEALSEAMPDQADDFTQPSLDWMKLKCVAETLEAYHTEDASLPVHVQRTRGGLVLQTQSESRYSLAADAVYDKVPEMHLWRVVAGYLQFDAPTRKQNARNLIDAYKQKCTLSPKEQTILLEVLHVSVRNEMRSFSKKLASGKLTKQQRADVQDDAEETARDLLVILPKLFERFGDSPDAAGVLLRVQQVLSADVVTGVGQESQAYDLLLEKDKRQFLSHISNHIPETAANAMLQAKLHGNDEAATEKVASLYENTISVFVSYIDMANIEKRGSSSVNQLADIGDCLLRLVELAKVSDPIDVLEDETSISKTARKSQVKAPVDLAIALLARAHNSQGRRVSPDVANLEDDIAYRAAELILFYMRWKFRSIKERVEGPNASDIPYADLELLAGRRDKYVQLLSTALEERRPREDICAAFAGIMIDLQIASSLLETVQHSPAVDDSYTIFIMEPDDGTAKSVMRAFAGAEAVYANLNKKRLETPDVEAGGRLDDDPESDPEDDDDDLQPMAGSTKSDERLTAILLAEQRLCVLTSKIVFAVLAGLMDRRWTRTRVERNKSVLGPNFKAVCEYFDHGKPAAKKSKARAMQAKQAVNGPSKKSHKSHAIVAESEDEDDIEDDDSHANGQMEG